MKRILTLLVTVALLALPLQAALAQSVTVSSKEFTEQLILGQISTVLLEENGIEVNDRLGLVGTMSNRQALETGQVDVYWEYTGTAWLTFFGQEEVLTDPDEAYRRVKAMDEENGLLWLAPAGFNNTYTLMMRGDHGSELGIVSISDFVDYIEANPGDLKFGSNAEFAVRPDGIPGLQRHYDFELPTRQLVKMQSGLLYQALRDGNVDVAIGFATDGRIAGFGFVNLVDDKQFFPVYNASPVLRAEVAAENPEVVGLLNQIGPSLDAATMTRMNYQVDILKESPEKVARDWLVGIGLIDG